LVVLQWSVWHGGSGWRAGLLFRSGSKEGGKLFSGELVGEFTIQNPIAVWPRRGVDHAGTDESSETARSFESYRQKRSVLKRFVANQTEAFRRQIVDGDRQGQVLGQRDDVAGGNAGGWSVRSKAARGRMTTQAHVCSATEGARSFVGFQNVWNGGQVAHQVEERFHVGTARLLMLAFPAWRPA
jgi:hypothetical protein